MYKNKTAWQILTAFSLLIISMSGLHAQQFTIEQINVANQTKVFADGCKLQLDTLSVSYDALLESEAYLSKANETLLNDLESAKVVAKGIEEEKLAVEKQLKKKIRQNRLKEGLLWTVSGVAAALIVLYLVK